MSTVHNRHSMFLFHSWSSPLDRALGKTTFACGLSGLISSGGVRFQNVSVKTISSLPLGRDIDIYVYFPDAFYSIAYRIDAIKSCTAYNCTPLHAKTQCAINSKDEHGNGGCGI